MPFILRPTVTQTYLERVRLTPDAVGFQYKPRDPETGPLGIWRSVSFGDFDKLCRQVSFGLMGLGATAGDKVAILSGTRFEWALCDMAILGARAVTVPVYASSTAQEVAYILSDSEARFVICEDRQQLEKILSARQCIHW